MDPRAPPVRRVVNNRSTPDDTVGTPRLLVVVADGVRPDVLADEIDRGRTPALARLRARGGLHTVTASFPSVTGPAYVPFVMGRHPAHAGLPGLRWFDRSGRLPWALGGARSYVGIDIWHTDHDVHPALPTLFELATPSLAGLMLLGRGATHGRIGRGVSWMLRAMRVHFRGDVHGWRTMERSAIRAFLARFAAVRPRLAMLGVVTPDKFSHAFGSDAEIVREGIRDVDWAVAEAHAIAAAQGDTDRLHVWVVGDHGHAPVAEHEDLQAWLIARGLRVRAHPQLWQRRPDIALMVSGNAMAHLYCEPAHRTRRWWPSLSARWNALREALLTRPAIDLISVAHDAHTVHVMHPTRGSALVSRSDASHDARWDYQPIDGDPLQLGGALTGLDADDAWHATATCPYPDALVQLTSLVTAPRSGDLVLSAAPGWDLRARYEPVRHISTHGALLRPHMEVPLLLDAPPCRLPQRTTDLVPSALQLLGVDPGNLSWDGRSFL